jgi:ubiquinone/menaquinone biosynthesis C-methylase UbiE
MIHTNSLFQAYQSLFFKTNNEAVQLARLHETSKEEYMIAYFDHEYNKWQKYHHRFCDFLPKTKGGIALDFGCGAGGLSLRISEFFEKTYGIDVDNEKIEFSHTNILPRRASTIQLVSYPGGILPFSDNFFDYVVSIDVLEHLPHLNFYIKEIYRVLRPGGQFIVSFGPPWYHPHGKHLWAKIPGWWSHLIFPKSTFMRALGLHPTTTWERLGLHRLTVGKFEKVIFQSPFACRYLDYLINRRVSILKHIPYIREFFISEISGVFEKT